MTAVTRRFLGFSLTLSWLCVFVAIWLWVSLTDGGFEASAMPFVTAVFLHFACVGYFWRRPGHWPVVMVGAITVLLVGLAPDHATTPVSAKSVDDLLPSIILMAPLVFGALLLKPSKGQVGSTRSDT